VRYVNPATGGDVLPTIRVEFHRLAPGAATAARRDVGSSVFQVFAGGGEVAVVDQTWRVERGDLFVVSLWTQLVVRSERGLDLFAFSDAPILEALHLDRSHA
jgi:gentisate 1,2-dioxygenase